jgi:hypothetical protein
VPILAGGAGMLIGAEIVRGTPAPVPPDLDSHFPLSVGPAVRHRHRLPQLHPRIEGRVRASGCSARSCWSAGSGRALSLLDVGRPGLEHRLALGMELGTMPLLMLWQWRVRAGGAVELKRGRKAKGPPDLVRRPL